MGATIVLADDEADFRTLYGATPPGGIINLTMRRPQGEFGGEVQGSYGSFDSWQAAGDVTGPIGDGMPPSSFTYFVIHKDSKLTPAEARELVDGLNKTIAAGHPKGGGG